MMKIAAVLTLSAVLSVGSVVGSPVWTTGEGNVLLKDGKPTVLHGLGSTCTEYLLRGIGEKCFATYQWNDPANVTSMPDVDAVDGIVEVVTTTKSGHPAIRIPLTASYWLGVRTTAAGSNFDKYPNLGAQYQSLIKGLVDMYTKAGIVSILDLHWSDDDTEQQPMPFKAAGAGHPTGDALEFWASIAQTFSSNTMAFFELYNEPHAPSVDVYLSGNAQYAGMLEMLATVRQHAPNNVVVIAGAFDYAYDAASLVTISQNLTAQGETAAMLNWHPYMGPAQAGDSKKDPAGFASMLKQLTAGSSYPLISTEFGQACCSTHGSCESYSGTWAGKAMGYDEAILTIATQYNMSWLPWGWIPSQTSAGRQCENTGCQTSTGYQLCPAVGGNGADFPGLWKAFA